MQIQIIKEKKWYFAQIIWELGIHAVWETSEKAVDILLNLYNNILELRKERMA